MVSEKVSFDYRGKRINLTARKCGVFNFGLMFRTKNTKPCLFEFNKPQRFRLTSLFVFFDFIVLWLNEHNEVTDMRKINPFTFSISTKKEFSSIVEIPINDKYRNLVRILVGNRKI